MKDPQIVVLGYSQAAMMLRTGAQQVGALISIRGAREPALAHQVARNLELVFDDIEVPTEPLSKAQLEIRLRREQADGLTRTPPARSHVEAIVSFADQMRDLDTTLLCQCSAGISRSAAAALVCLATWAAFGDEA